MKGLPVILMLSSLKKCLEIVLKLMDHGPRNDKINFSSARLSIFFNEYMFAFYIIGFTPRTLKQKRLPIVMNKTDSNRIVQHSPNPFVNIQLSPMSAEWFNLVSLKNHFFNFLLRVLIHNLITQRKG